MLAFIIFVYIILGLSDILNYQFFLRNFCLNYNFLETKIISKVVVKISYFLSTKKYHLVLEVFTQGTEVHR